ncbi:hypothetical protein MtrunA17_Chr3g0081721 [Medicago truncatula]|uniref:Uncharacterized protein n=1 Tax=Medicago truncatula TaxID=3880 RepID=G7IVU4_MEDTR|nr:uncharacterized protein LOC11423016 [Medicago truncatula]AES68677.1 hypothetical protein MTR_3g013540 [Medicago truncatula]RHN65609.1 hypothetical protein MtrunA17_Chr3g0081721 [Medicago truncatula]
MNNTNNNNILLHSTQVQVWNNAAFDGEDFAMNSSSDSIKENLNPSAFNIVPSSNKRTIDDEIAEIESEIKRLTSKLELLRVEKAERKIASEKRVSGIGTGRIVAAKFMEPKKNVTPKRNGVVFKEETPKRNGVVSDTPKSRVNWRRGMSLGPMEIAGKVMAPPAMTITPATVNRRKSCFWKPQESCEVMPSGITPATVNRRKSCFLKPQESCEENRRKTICKPNLNLNSNSVNSAVGSIKRVKKKDEEIAQVQPKKLFEGEKSVKKSLKQGRIVASRYNSGGGGGDARKRSFSENNKGLGSEIRAKKRWEIPIEEVDVSGFVMLPKISTMRFVDESPRDSGAVKRVAELNGKRSYFCDEDEEERVMVEEEGGSVCQVLNFAEDDDDDDDYGEQG